VANALFDALGVRVDQVPIAPGLVLEALSREDRRAGPRSYPDLRAGKPVRILTPEEGGDGYEVDQERKKKQKRREERAKA